MYSLILKFLLISIIMKIMIDIHEMSLNTAPWLSKHRHVVKMALLILEISGKESQEIVLYLLFLNLKYIVFVNF